MHFVFLGIPTLSFTIDVLGFTTCRRAPLPRPPHFRLADGISPLIIHLHHPHIPPKTNVMTAMTSDSKLVILYGIGGLSDVGRHAILAALEREVPHIVVITEYPELLDVTNWECGCPGGHTNPAKDHPDIVKVFPIENWKSPVAANLLEEHFVGATAVISCLGHRQPGYVNKLLIQRGLVAHEGNVKVIEAMKKTGLSRAVVMSSMGVQEDWPPMEYHFAGRIMARMFNTNSKRAFQDLTQMELAYKEESNKDLDYLFVRPVGISEGVKPCGEFFLQNEKGKDALGIDMAKLDVARFMVKEALEPTFHRRGVVIGAQPPGSRKKK